MRNSKTILQTKKKILKYYIISVIFYGSEYWRITSERMRRPGANVVLLKDVVHMGKTKILKKMETK